MFLELFYASNKRDLHFPVINPCYALYKRMTSIFSPQILKIMDISFLSYKLRPHRDIRKYTKGVDQSRILCYMPEDIVQFFMLRDFLTVNRINAQPASMPELHLIQNNQTRLFPPSISQCLKMCNFPNYSLIFCVFHNDIRHENVYNMSRSNREGISGVSEKKN